MAKNQDGYLSAKESRRISKENRRITDQYEKRRKRRKQQKKAKLISPVPADTGKHPRKRHAIEKQKLVVKRIQYILHQGFFPFMEAACWKR